MAVPEWQIPGYENLRLRILQQAVDDYRAAIKKSRLKGEKIEAEDELEKFFLSHWGQMLSGDNGKYIIDRCQKDHSSNRRQGQSQKLTDDEQVAVVSDYLNGMKARELRQKYGITYNDIQRYLKKWSYG